MKKMRRNRSPINRNTISWNCTAIHFDVYSIDSKSHSVCVCKTSNQSRRDHFIMLITLNEYVEALAVRIFRCGNMICYACTDRLKDSCTSRLACDIAVVCVMRRPMPTEPHNCIHVFVFFFFFNVNKHRQQAGHTIITYYYQHQLGRARCYDEKKNMINKNDRA